MPKIEGSEVSASVNEKRFDERLSLFLLPALAASLIATNRWFTVIDDEAFIIDRAAKPARQTIQLFLSGVGEHQHPPLYDLILHGWLRLTNGNMHLLRLPAIAFFVLGVWVLAMAAKLLGGSRSQACVLWIAALSPYGFHFGRVAVWYSFCFLLISLVTFCYLNFLSKSTRANWLWLFLSSLCLVYSNYFGWALLGCLALDYVVRNMSRVATWWLPFLATGALLLIAYVPVFAAFVSELHRGPHADFHPLSVAANGVYNLYCLFVSESVAPWYWVAGVSAGLATGVCLILTLLRHFLACEALTPVFLRALLHHDGIGYHPAKTGNADQRLGYPTRRRSSRHSPKTIPAPDDCGVSCRDCYNRLARDSLQKFVRCSSLD